MLIQPGSIVLPASSQGRTGYTIDVDGHADDVGFGESNFALSLARAYRVRTYLMGRGIPGSGSSSTAMAPSDPP